MKKTWKTLRVREIRLCMEINGYDGGDDTQRR